MALEGYGLVANAIEIAFAIRKAVAANRLISKYFRVLGADKMVPAEFRSSGFTDFLARGVNWGQVLHSLKEDEFCLDPTRRTLVCGTAGFDGTQFKGILANRYGIQVNKTSRNSVLIQSNINNTRSDVAHLIRVLAEISGEIERDLNQGGVNAVGAFAARTKSLMTDVPDLPNFSHFHEGFRGDAGARTNEGDIRSGFYAAYDEAGCERIRLNDPEIDRRLGSGPDLISANFVIPYPFLRVLLAWDRIIKSIVLERQEGADTRIRWARGRGRAGDGTHCYLRRHQCRPSRGPQPPQQISSNCPLGRHEAGSAIQRLMSDSCQPVPLVLILS